MRNAMSAGLLPGLHDGLRVGGDEAVRSQRASTSVISETRHRRSTKVA